MNIEEIHLVIKSEPISTEENLKDESEIKNYQPIMSEETKCLFDKFYSELILAQDLKQKDLYNKLHYFENELENQKKVLSYEKYNAEILNQEIMKLKKEIDELKIENEILQNRVEILNNQMDIKIKELDNMKRLHQDEINKNIATHKQHSNHKAYCKKEMKQLKESLSLETSKNTSMIKQIQQQNQSNKTLMDNIEKCQRQIKSLTDENNKLNEDIMLETVKVDEHNTKIINLEKEITRLEEIESKYLLNFDIVTNCSKKIKQLETENSEYSDKVMTMIQKEDDLKNQIKILEEETSQKNSEITKLNSSNGYLQDELNNYKLQFDEMLEKEKENFKRSELLTQKEYFQNKISDLKHDNETKILDIQKEVNLVFQNFNANGNLSNRGKFHNKRYFGRNNQFKRFYNYNYNRRTDDRDYDNRSRSYRDQRSRSRYERSRTRSRNRNRSRSLSKSRQRSRSKSSDSDSRLSSVSSVSRSRSPLAN